MRVDGKQLQRGIAEDLKGMLDSTDTSLRLDLVYVGNDPVIETFMRLKKSFGEKIGVSVVMHTFAESTDEKKIKAAVETISSSPAVNGVVIQLPLPPHIDADMLMDGIPENKDVDLLSQSAYAKFKAGNSSILPPVVGAVAEIFSAYNVELSGKEIAVVGRGELVGDPMTVWLENNGVSPNVFEKGDDLAALRTADIIISGAGDPHIITPEHIKTGVVIIDAGTAQADGGIKGDVDPACEEKASLYSPVPGGVGPLTVAMVFKNMIVLNT